MKRLIVLSLVLLALTVPIFAAPIVAGTEGASELTYGFIVGADGTIKDRWTNMLWTTVANIDPNNYIVFGFTSTSTPFLLSSFGLRAFSGNMYLNQLFNLPKDVSIKLKFGWDDVIAVNYMPSGYEYENAMGFDPGPRGVFALAGTSKVVNFNVAFDPGTAVPGWEPLRQSNLLANVYGSIGPVAWSAVYWSANQSDYKKGKIAGDIYVSKDFGIWGCGFDTEYSYDMGDPTASVLGLAAVANYSWASLDVSTNYTHPTATNTAGFNNLGFGLELRPDTKLKRFGGSLGVDVNMNPQVTIPIRSVDASVWMKAPLGPGKLRFGYLWTKTGNGGGDYYAPTALPNGGTYFKYDMSW
jgi:hypothetical protein